MREKNGLDYFQLDTNLSIKVELIEATHGIIGFGVWVKLLQEVYKSRGEIVFDSPTILILARRFGVERDLLLGIINTCIEAGLFEEDAYNTKKQLTSAGIRRRIEGVEAVREKWKNSKNNSRTKTPDNDVHVDKVQKTHLSTMDKVQKTPLSSRTIPIVHVDMPTEKRREEKRRVDQSREEVCTPTPTDIPTVVIPHTHTNKSSPDKNTVFNPESLAMPASLNCPELQASWLQWCEHAKDIRLTLTRTSAQLQLAQVLELGVERFCKAVNHSIVSGWKTIHEDKGGSSPPVRNTQLSRQEAQEAIFNAVIEAEENNK